MAGYFRNIFKTLNECGVRYLVVGGVAVNLYGVLRTTADLDIIVNLTEENILLLVKALEKLGYKPKVPINIKEFADPEIRNRWIEEKGMKVLGVYPSDRQLGEIDIFVTEPFDFDEAYQKRIDFDVGDGIIVPVVSLDDLIYLKKESARSQDLADIEALEILKGIQEKKK
ncbi:hypothetical protein DRQ33_05375 [bacterium]|nr:MAG: hypothetical protein DRQ33_05375 [bacterium]